MKHEDIIATKIAYLNGDASEDISSEMIIYVNSKPALKEELAFIESLWASQSIAQEQKPSSELDARFYQMLSQAQAAQPVISDATQNTEVHERRSKGQSLFELIANVFAPKAMAQFALLVIVFFSGWLINNPNGQQYQQVTDKLEKQVSTLNTMVAMSMLQNQSATERLAGVTYTSTNSTSGSELNGLLIDLLNNDTSNAVRLAVVDALSKRDDLNTLQTQLLGSIEQQSNPLVQISLIQLALRKDFVLQETLLKSLLENESLDNDVLNYLKDNQKKLTNKHHRV